MRPSYRSLQQRPLTAYLRIIVLPTLAELMDAPGDQRRAYLACITAAHLVDHVCEALGLSDQQKHDVRQAVRALGPYSTACLAIVEGVSNGTKHAQPDTKLSQRFKFAPGYERLVPVFSLDVEGARLDEGMWDAPGLVVGYPSPAPLEGMGGYLLDDSGRAVVRGCATAFPTLFESVDIADVAPKRDRFASHGPVPTSPETSP